MSELDQLKAIRDGAPDGATHVDGDGCCWILSEDYQWHIQKADNTFEDQYGVVPDVSPVQSLSDITRQIELLEEVERLRESLSLALKVNDHERLVDNPLRNFFSDKVARYVKKLESEVERLTNELKYVDEKITSARICHPMAVQTLLEEAANRTHLKEFNND